MTVTSQAQNSGPGGLVISRSVNMVSGDSWPNGDPFLQRQNEPSVAASTRNPQHLLAGANDYRTVDLPGLSTGPETGDAWLGLFKSFDGGERWQSTLLPGYPQDTSAEGKASPLKGFQAGADPVVRPGTNGLMYYAGLAFNRGENQPSAVFMSRFIDNNNKENGDPIRYLGTTIIDKSTGADFIDKPWMAVDVPRTGAKTCRIVTSDPIVVKPGKGWGRFDGWKKREIEKKKNGKVPPKPKDPKPTAQSIPAGRIYVAYSRITTIGANIESRIMFSQSEDCGVSWSKPVQLSSVADKVNQGATVAIDPNTGAVYVAWRQFGLTVNDTDAVVVVRSSAPGKPFNAAAKVHKFNAKRPTDRLKRMIAEHRMGDADEVAEIQPFDQGTAEDRFRTNAYPTMAIDDDGRAYVAWTERGFGKMRGSATDGDARVVVSTSRTGAAWTAPQPVDTGVSAATDPPGHQLMPSISFAAGKLVVVYYDLREDVSRVFGPFIDENDAIVTVRKRHTIDIRAAYAAKGDAPVFGQSVRLSQYMMGSRPGSTDIEQMQYNAPSLPLFKLGTVPFLGDYIDLAPAPAFVQNTQGVWGFNTAPAAAPVFHVVWTDNRDVRPPRDGNWANYTPAGLPAAASKFDPSQPTPACVAGQTGMRNQNIYSARLTWGLVAGSPGNSKPLDATTPRSFVVFAQNTLPYSATTSNAKTYKFTIASQPVGGVASFTQGPVAGSAYPLTSVYVTVAPKSMVTRSVFVTSSDSDAQVPVDIQEVAAPGLPVLTGGLASRVVLNPDISNPDISNPDISNPDISNPDISNAEVYNPDISNPDISNPDISNPDISNPDISNPDISNIVVANPDISNPDISNPDISNPDISNPDISNPDISNPDISNGALTDVTWTIVNTGNTTASFNVNLFLRNAASKLAGVKTQMVVHKTYTTPVADGCVLKSQTQTVLVANVPNPTFQEPGTSTTFDPTDASVTNTTLWLEPGGEGKITLRIIDPNPQDNITINPVRDVTPVVTAEPKNTEDLGTPVIPPPSTAPPTAPDVMLGFISQPTNTILTLPTTLPKNFIVPVQAHAQVNGGPAAGVQVTIAIAVNPSGGHLSGTTTLLTDQFGNAIFSDLSIERAGAGYQLSASASASGALPDLSAPFDVTFAPTMATAIGGLFVYDGQPHTGSCSFVGMGGVILSGSLTYSTIAAPVNAGAHTVTCDFAGDGYFGPASANAAITITPAPSTTSVTCADAVYTGAPRETCTATATGAGGLNQSVPVTYTNNVNAGTATGTASFAGDANHSASDGSNTFTISKAGSLTSVTCADAVYAGTPRETCTATATGAGGLSQARPVSYTDNVDVGTATGNAAFGGDANHAASDGSSSFAITPAASSTSVTCSDAVYTGAPRETCTATATGAGGLNQNVLVTYTNNVNAGTATGSASFAGDANHSASDGTNTFMISKAGSLTSVTCADAVYTGTPRETCTATATGAGGLSQARPVSYTDNVDVGTATGNASFPGDANHTASDGSDTFEITPAASATTVTCSAAEYTGTPRETCTATATGAGGLNQAVPVTYTDNVNAGTATGSAAFGGDANHAASDGSSTFTITRAPSTTTVTCSDAAYTGAPRETCTAAATGVGGLNQAVPVTYTDNVNAGTATGSAAFGGDANHAASDGSNAFTISPAASSTSVTCAEAVYAGTPRETCSATATGPGGLNQNVPVTYANNVTVGTATGDATFAGDANHTGSSGSNTFAITRATPVATATGGNFQYDAQPHGGTCVVNGVNGEVLSGAISYSSGTPPVNPGVYTVFCDYAASSNYTAASDSAPIAITLPANSFVVTTTADTMTPGTLRYAIAAANTAADNNAISFAIPAGPLTITVASPLPTLSTPMVIDATTQAGYAGTAVVRLDAGTTSARGFEFTAPGTVKGLMITGFDGPNVYGVWVRAGASGTVIENNIIGTDASGAGGGLSNGRGVLSQFADNVIVRNNVISNNITAGVVLAEGANALVANNRIGTSPNGLASVPNGNGVVIDNGHLNATISGNVISGNNARGIDVRNTAGAVTGLRVVGNTIGLAVDGLTRLANRVGGIALAGTEGAVIGEPGAGNVISGNGVFNAATSGTPPLDCDASFPGNGIDVTAASTVIPVIRANTIGTDASGEVALPNVWGGIVLSAPAVIGGTGAGAGNLISGNGCAANGQGTGIGVNVSVTAAGTVIQGNTLGLSKTTESGLGNGYSGITVNNTGGVLIGGPAAGAGNVISGNPQMGVAIYQQGVPLGNPPNPMPTGVVVQGNIIGRAKDGLTLKPNGVFGVYAANATGITIGGAGAGEGNLIASNTQVGVAVTAASSRVTIFSNTIVANGGLGIDLNADGVTNNDAGDGDTGPNTRQNYPVITSADNSGATTTANLSLNSIANESYTIEVFANVACDPSGRGEGERMVGRFLATTDVSGNVVTSRSLSELVPVGQFLTATATDAFGNTSEFSSCLQVVNPASITSVTPANGKSGEGYLAVRGTNLPTGVGNVVALLVSGPTTASGQILFSTSTPTAVYVRLQGLPLGAATIQLKNNAGTTVSNVYPITVSSNPGTPVVRGVLDGASNPVVAPVAPGDVIQVQADGIDTTGAVVRFVQGASSWDVGVGATLSSPTIGMAGQVNVPGAAVSGAIDVSIRQGASAFSIVTTLTVLAPVSPYVVTNTTDAGLGSLRFAITSANANPDLNTITFAIVGAGPQTLSPATPLPAITQPVAIDGLTQFGAASMAPTVFLNGTGLSGQSGVTIGQAPGFEVLTSGAAIRGLGIHNFPGPGVYVASFHNANTIEDNVIGSRLNLGGPGWVSAGNASGVYTVYSNSNVVRRNAISGNNGDGMLVVGGSNNSITNNRIGMAPDGLAVLSNAGNGVTAYDGSTSTVFDSNLISGNNGWGIDLQQSGALADVTFSFIRNNTIGLDAAGNVIRRGATDMISGGGQNFGPALRGNLGGGIKLKRAAGTEVGAPGAGNVISGNTLAGIWVEGPMSTTPVIHGNKIGTDPTGKFVRGNVTRGVTITNSTVTVGGSGIGDRNIISGNIGDGVFSDGNARIEGNYIGTDVDGTYAMGNGLLDDGGAPVVPGCCHVGVFVVAPLNIVKGNLVSGNSIAGIRSGGATGAAPNLIENNKVGSDWSGTAGIPNGEGIGLYGDKAGTQVYSNLIAFNTTAAVRLVEGTVGALIGGLGPGAGNTIRNNGQAVLVGYNAAATGDVNNRILSNIVTGSGLAIDLGSDGQTANDGGSGNYDTDTGPNNLQNSPIINSAVNQTTTRVDYTPHAAAGVYTFQFFSGANCTGAEALVKTSTVFVNGNFQQLVEDLGVLLPVGTRVFMTATDSAGNTSEFKACVDVTAPAPAFTPWSSSGSGSTSTADNGVADGTPSMSYQHNGVGVFNGSWQFSTVATVSGPVNLDWAYSGFHSYYMVTARLDVFVNRGGSDVFLQTLLNAGPQNCCYSPSGGFNFSGSTLVTVQPGDTYGFRMYGSHYDGTYTLQGSLSVVVGGVQSPLLPAESGLRALNERGDFVEHVVRGAVVEEDRRRLAAPRQASIELR